MKTRVIVHVEKCIIVRGLGWLQMVRASGTMFAMWSVSLKFQHQKHHWNVLRVECTLVRVNLEFRTLVFNTTLPRWHDMRKKYFPYMYATK